MKPNYEQMTYKELVRYILTHREDDEAFKALYERRTPDDQATWYPAPCQPDGTPIEENIRIMEEAIRQRIERSQKNPNY